MGKLNLIDSIALVLVLIGAFNWGLVGVFHFNLVSYLLGDGSILAEVLYGVVGLSAIYTALIIKKLSA